MQKGLIAIVVLIFCLLNGDVVISQNRTRTKSTRADSEKTCISPGEVRARRLKNSGENLMSEGKFDEVIAKFRKALKIPDISLAMEDRLRELVLRAITMSHLEDNKKEN